MRYVVNDRGALAVVFWTEASFKAFYVIGQPKDSLAETEVQREEHLKHLIRVQFADAPGEHRVPDRRRLRRLVDEKLLKFVTKTHRGGG